MTVDSGGYPWIGYDNYSDSTGYCFPYVTKSSTNDGTWSTASGFPYKPSTEAGQYRMCFCTVILLTSSKVYCIYGHYNYPLKGRLYTGTWGAEEAVSTSNIQSGPAPVSDYHSAVALGDDVYVTLLVTSSNNIVSVKRTYGTGWGSEVTVQSAVTSTSAPVLSGNPANNELYVFWAGSPTANHIYYKKYRGGSWDASPSDWINEGTLPDNQGLTCFYQSYGSRIGLAYRTKAGNPYNIKFAYLTLNGFLVPGMTTNDQYDINFTIGSKNFCMLFIATGSNSGTLKLFYKATGGGSWSSGETFTQSGIASGTTYQSGSTNIGFRLTSSTVSADGSVKFVVEKTYLNSLGATGSSVTNTFSTTFVSGNGNPGSGGATPNDRCPSSGTVSWTYTPLSPTLLTFNSKYVVPDSTHAVTTTSTTLSNDTYASQMFSLTASQTVLVIYQANNVYGTAMPTTGMQNAISVDGTDYANSWDSPYDTTDCITRNTVFWIGTLASGSHTIKGRFASGTSGSTATISNRVLLIYILNGDAFLYLDSSTTSTTTSVGPPLVDDPEASFTFTPPSQCKALFLYNVANSGATEDINGKMAAINIGGTDYSQAEKSPNQNDMPDSIFTVWAQQLSASTTVKGSFARNGGNGYVTINRRQLGVLMFADTTLLDVLSSDNQIQTTYTSLQDDTYATISRITSDTRELLVVAMGTKRHSVSSNEVGECYGIKVNTNDRANSRGSASNGPQSADSAATAYAENLAAGSQTIQGRYATNNAGTWDGVISSRRIVALWLSYTPPVPEYPFGTAILTIPMVAMYFYLRRRLYRDRKGHYRTNASPNGLLNRDYGVLDIE